MSSTYRRQIKISNACGLSLRTAFRFVELGRQFQSEIRVCSDELVTDGRSILDLMTLAAACGARLEIETTGQDAEAASAALCALIDAAVQDKGDPRDLV
jgi:phosphocarrier protein